MDTEYVDQGAQIQSVSELDEETRQAWSEMQDKFRDKENESLEHVQYVFFHFLVYPMHSVLCLKPLPSLECPFFLTPVLRDQILEKCNEYCASDWHRLKHEACITSAYPAQSLLHFPSPTLSCISYSRSLSFTSLPLYLSTPIIATSHTLSALLQSRQKSAVRRWVGLSRFLLGYRGILDDGRPRSERIVRHWKLDSAENFSRMRLRLAPFYSFDQHTRAAELRDNAIEKGAPVPELDSTTTYDTCTDHLPALLLIFPEF